MLYKKITALLFFLLMTRVHLYAVQDLESGLERAEHLHDLQEVIVQQDEVRLPDEVRGHGLGERIARIEEKYKDLKLQFDDEEVDLMRDDFMHFIAKGVGLFASIGMLAATIFTLEDCVGPEIREGNWPTCQVIEEAAVTFAGCSLLSSFYTLKYHRSFIRSSLRHADERKTLRTLRHAMDSVKSLVAEGDGDDIDSLIRDVTLIEQFCGISTENI